MRTSTHPLLVGILAASLAVIAAGSPALAADPTGPTVVSKTPAGPGTDLGAGGPIRVTFSEPVVWTGAIVVQGTAPGLTAWKVAGVTSNDGEGVLAFQPAAPLIDGPLYAVTITGVKSMSGADVPKVTWTFSGIADTTPPKVLWAEPAGTNPSIVQATSVVVRISERIANPSAVKFTVSGAAPGLSLKMPGTLTIEQTTTAGTMLIYRLSTAFHVGPVYTATVSGVRDWSGKLMPTYTWKFSAGSDTEAPRLGDISPLGEVSSLDGIGRITAYLSEPLANPSALKVSVVGTAPGLPKVTVAGTTTITDGSAATRIVFVPKAGSFPYGPTYTVTVSGARDWGGNPLAQTWTFSGPIDTKAPVLKVQTPDGPADVAHVTRVVAGFDEPLALLGKGAVVTVIARAQNLPDVKIAGTTVYDAANTRLVFTPRAALTPGPVYSVTVTGIRDRSGNAAATIEWTFKSDVPDVLPSVTHLSIQDGDRNVPVNRAIEVGFSEPLALQGKTATVTILWGPQHTTPATPLAGKLVYRVTDNTLVFTPSKANLPGRTYSVSVTGARDRSGNLVEPLTLKFDGPELDTQAPFLNLPTLVVNPGKPAIVGTMSEPSTGLKVTAIQRTPFGVTTPMPITVVYDPATLKVTITPTAELMYGNWIDISVSGAKDAAGNLMQPYTFANIQAK